jgi:ABC-type sugar transport system ATPase subunit
MDTDNPVILQMQGICKSFPGVLALSEVDFCLRKGRLTAVLGENGAGKSTLMRIIAGALQADSGSFALEGKEVCFSEPKQALEAGVAMIYQELNLVQELTIAENIFLGREPRNWLGFIDYPRMNAAAQVLLQRLDLHISSDTILNTLRVGQQQIVEIAKAISHEARVVIMDEPTSAISDHEVRVLFQIIEDLKQQGVAIAYITHKMDELEPIADDFVVMRDGCSVGKGNLKEVSRNELIQMMVGRNVGSLFQKSEHHTTDSHPRLEVKNLNLKHPTRKGDYLAKDISFTVNAGEVLGVFGLMGAGRTEMLEVVYGLHARESSREIWIEGAPVTISDPATAIQHGITLVPEDRKSDGLILNMTVADNCSLPSLDRLSRFGFIDQQAEKKLVRDSIDRLRVKTPGIDEVVQNLSGGNQQKVILGKWLAMNPRVILLDEPTRGIDIGAKKEIYALIDALALSGLAVVMVSSELPEILAISDRVMVLSEGRKTAEFHRSELNEQSIMEAALPRS